MPRLARLEVPGLLRHVIIRGIEHRNIFEDNNDRDNLLKRLEQLLPATKTSCYAWAMLSFPGAEKMAGPTPEPFFCFWAVRELGYGQRELAIRLGMTQPGVGYAVIKGEAISKSNGYRIKS